MHESRIADSKNTKSLFKHIRTKLSGPVAIIQIRDNSGILTDNISEVANILADTFSTVFTRESLDAIPNVSGPPNLASLSEVDFSECAIYEKLKKLDVSKSPGPDFITTMVLKCCADVLSEPIGILMRQSFDTASLPPDWRTAIIRPFSRKEINLMLVIIDQLVLLP